MKRAAQEWWYRAEIRQYCGCSLSESGLESHYLTPPKVVISKYRVLKRTPKGVWLRTGIGGKRFALEAARRRFACPTKQEALDSLVARKKAEVGHCKRRLETALEHQRVAETAARKEEA